MKTTQMTKEELRTTVLILLAMIVITLVIALVQSKNMMDLQWELIELQSKRIDQLENIKLK